MKFKIFLVPLLALPLVTACSNAPLISGAKPAGGFLLKLYPDPRESLTRAGEEITFAITPLTKDKSFTIFYGDGSSQTVARESISCSAAGKCQPIHINHTYQVGKAYYPYVKYDDSEDSKGKFKIIIARSDMKSDKEIEKLAINNFSNQLIGSLKKYCSQPHERHKGCGKEKNNFALGLLTDANFEQNQSSQKIFTIAKDLSLSMLNNGFNVLEKNPQALTRLAYEAVVESEDESGKRIPYKKGRPLEHITHLEYSLQKGQRGIVVEGTNDTEIIEKASAESSAKSTSAGKGSKTSTSLKERTANEGADAVSVGEEINTQGNKDNVSSTETSKRKRVRPILLAKFKTANYLLVLHEIEKLSIIRKPGQFYSTTYNTGVSKREASMFMNVRLLSREGEILWMDDIKGSYTDQLAHSQSPNSPETVIPVPKLYQQELVVKAKAAGVAEQQKGSRSASTTKASMGWKNIPIVGPMIVRLFGS